MLCTFITLLSKDESAPLAFVSSSVCSSQVITATIRTTQCSFLAYCLRTFLDEVGTSNRVSIRSIRTGYAVLFAHQTEIGPCSAGLLSRNNDLLNRNQRIFVLTLSLFLFTKETHIHTSILLLAAEPGFEPGLKDPKSSVLPLHNSAFLYPAEGRTRTDTEVALQQFLRLSRLPIPPLRLVSLFYAKIGDDAIEDGEIDSGSSRSYNIVCAEVAQSVEQRTENPRVPSSILGLGTSSFLDNPQVASASRSIGATYRVWLSSKSILSVYH